MRIAFEAQRIFRKHKHGMDFVALELIKRLQILDKENEYIVFTNHGPDTACLKESDNVKIVTFNAPFPIWEQILLPHYVKKYNCQILHCTSNTAPVFCSVPIILTLHDIIYLEQHPILSTGYNHYQRFGNLYRRQVVQLNLKRVELIITVSNFEKQKIMDFTNSLGKSSEVVYNGVASQFFNNYSKEETSGVVEKYSLPDRYALFLGNTDPKKNTTNTLIGYIKYLINTGSEMPLVIADLDIGVVRRILASVGLESFLDKVYLCGYIQNKDMPIVLKEAELLLYTSKRESFGIPILEAMACSTPVITSNAASMPEISDGCAYLVDPESVDSIAKGLEEVLSNEILREKMREKGKRRAELFTWDSSAKKMISIYKSVFKG